MHRFEEIMLNTNTIVHTACNIGIRFNPQKSHRYRKSLGLAHILVITILNAGLLSQEYICVFISMFLRMNGNVGLIVE